MDRPRAVFGVGYALAFIVTALAIWIVAVAPGSAGDGRTTAIRIILYILSANLVLIGLLAAVVGRQVLTLVRGRHEAGSRLHLRFVVLFSFVSVLPAILIALVFGVLVNRGVDQWFSENVSSSVQNGAAIGQAYVADVGAGLERDLETITIELGSVRSMFDNRIQFSRALTQIGAFFGYPALYILNDKGEVLASGLQPNAPPYVAPPPEAFATLAEGEQVPATATENPDSIRALYPLPDYDDAYLYVVRPLAPGLIQRMRTGEESILAYRQAEQSRAQIQAAFALAYLETALLILVGAVWLAMSAANAISRPIGQLIDAAEKVSAGDLEARVDASGAPAEMAVLSEAFNRMTYDIQSQQVALRSASVEAQTRSRFIETVLSGVSAGVIGLDRYGRISAINDSARELLAIVQDDVQGQRLGEVSPELSELSERGEAHIEEDIDVTRDGETRRLRVRIEGGQGGEMVLTFDDITRLVTAQRNAAWRDVARRIAHEIKNPLTPIQLSAERLRRRYRDKVEDDVEVFDRCTETIIRQVGDIGRMVDEFSSFARMPAPRFTEERADEMLREAVFAQRVAAADIGVELAEPVPELVLDCDGRMVRQALINILKNAGEAVSARKASGAETAVPGIAARLDVSSGWARFIIEDDGIGLPEKDRDRLTEPYVTTREKGTGLGLAIVKRICEDHGGELRLGDAEGLSGARVTLVFPLRQSMKSAQKPSSMEAGGDIKREAHED
ncbi:MULTISPECIES: sensor histidine kinase NtrY-like [unclassified Brevundimonas]|uniref:sensor histidine kinase NtrY-like n=1 Tax=unclassified Brevundimonas TaxID=2622653 RepID=UPI0025B873E9|nr:MULTISPECIES: PAS domain-containing sensor histidine kinase [unclassified Brevundimonas]